MEFSEWTKQNDLFWGGDDSFIGEEALNMYMKLWGSIVGGKVKFKTTLEQWKDGASDKKACQMKQSLWINQNLCF